MVRSNTDSAQLLLRFDDVAERLGISPRLVRTLVEGGYLRSVRVGRLHRVALRDIEEYVDGLRGKAASR